MDRSDRTGCWLWTASIRNGYGAFAIRHGLVVDSHRVSYEHFVGPITQRLHVCHRCDVRRCVRPNHLFLGTAGDNIRDKVGKGRHTFGVTIPQAKLNEETVRLIRTDPRPYRVIGQEFGVAPATVCRVKTRESWKHVS